MNPLLSTGRVQPGKSMFVHPQETAKEQLASFEPAFSEDVLSALSQTERSEAKRICGDNKQCLLDYAITGEASKPNQVHTYLNVIGTIQHLR